MFRLEYRVRVHLTLTLSNKGPFYTVLGRPQNLPLIMIHTAPSSHPHHTPVDSGGTKAYSLSRDILYLGKTDGPFYGLFHIIFTPFYGTFFQLTPYLGNIMVTPFPFFLFFFSSGLGNMCAYFNHYPRAALPEHWPCNKSPILIFWEATEGSGNIYV